MPRPPKRQQAVAPTTALVASAHRYLGKVPRIYAPSSEWQKRCYHHYSMCGEARFAARYFGHAMSRAVLYPSGPDGARIQSGAPVYALQTLFGGPDGQAGMLELVGVHLVVAGECYLVGRNVDGVDIWEVLSVLEVDGSVAGWKIRAVDSEAWIPLASDDVVIRVWVPKPDRRWEADSPFRSMLPVLDEIERLSRYIDAQTSSRLTGNGILFLPDGLTFPPPPPVDGKEQEVANEADAFMLTLGSAAMEALKGNGAPSEMIPLVVTANGDALSDIQHITFWTELDENAREMRRDAIQRFALGMDLPPEMVLGMGSNEGTGGGRSNGVSHWGAWMLEEQTIKLHIEPMLDVLCAALTSYYSRPLTGGNEIIKADTTSLKLRPDRSKEAVEMYNLGQLKASVMLAENGFAETDMPDDEERKMWLLMKVASGSATPEQVQAALEVLGVDLPVATVANQEEPRETPPPPSLEDHPVRPRDPSESPYGVYEVLVLRALERAGNRLRNITQSRPPGKAYEAHVHLAANGSSAKCMEDAWEMAELVLAGNPEATKIVSTLDSFCKALLNNQQPYTRDALEDWCRKAGV
jgi:hypothetical protein